MDETVKKTDFDQERRAAPRHKINLRAPVFITAFPKSAAGKKSYFFLRGELFDVSLSGLALILGYTDLYELNMRGKDLTMRLLLPLPIKSIELEVTPVRYQRLEENANDKLLVGTYITNMNKRDRALFIKFISDCETQRN